MAGDPWCAGAMTSAIESHGRWGLVVQKSIVSSGYLVTLGEDPLTKNRGSTYQIKAGEEENTAGGLGVIWGGGLGGLQLAFSKTVQLLWQKRTVQLLIQC